MGRDTALQEGSLCLFAVAGATQVSRKAWETSQKFSPIKSTAMLGHHRIHTGSCKTAEHLPSQHIPFSPSLNCRAKQLRMFRSTVLQQQLSSVTHLFIHKEKDSLILTYIRKIRYNKKTRITVLQAGSEL